MVYQNRGQRRTDGVANGVHLGTQKNVTKGSLTAVFNLFSRITGISFLGQLSAYCLISLLLMLFWYL